MKSRAHNKDENNIGLLMQDTLESYFEYEDCINPSESHKQNIKYKLEKLIDMLKKTDNQWYMKSGKNMS